MHTLLPARRAPYSFSIICIYVVLYALVIFLSGGSLALEHTIHPSGPNSHIQRGWTWAIGGHVLQSQADSDGVVKDRIIAALRQQEQHHSSATQSGQSDGGDGLNKRVRDTAYGQARLAAVPSPGFGSGAFLRSLQHDALLRTLERAFGNTSFSNPQDAPVLVNQLTLLVHQLKPVVEAHNNVLRDSGKGENSWNERWDSVPNGSERLRILIRDAQEMEAENIQKVATRLAATGPLLQKYGIPPLPGQVASIAVAWSGIPDPSPNDFIALYVKGHRDHDAAIQLLKAKIESEKAREISDAEEHGGPPVKSIKRTQLEAQLEAVLNGEGMDDRFEFISVARNRARASAGIAIFTVVNVHAPFVFRYYRSKDGPEIPWPWFHGRPALLPKRAELVAESNTLTFMRGVPQGIHLVPSSQGFGAIALTSSDQHASTTPPTVGVRVVWTSDRSSTEGVPQVEWEPVAPENSPQTQEIVASDVGDTRYIPNSLMGSLRQFAQSGSDTSHAVDVNLDAVVHLSQALSQEATSRSNSLSAALQSVAQEAQYNPPDAATTDDGIADEAALSEALNVGASSASEAASQVAASIRRGPVLNLEPLFRTDDDVAAYVKLLLSPRGVGQISRALRAIRADREQKQKQARIEAGLQAPSATSPAKEKPTRGNVPLFLLAKSLAKDFSTILAYEQAKGDDLGWGTLLSASNTIRDLASIHPANDMENALRLLVAKYNSDSIHWRMRHEPGPLSGARAGFPRVFRPRSGRGLAAAMLELAEITLRRMNQERSSHSQSADNESLDSLIRQSLAPFISQAAPTAQPHSQPLGFLELSSLVTQSDPKPSATESLRLSIPLAPTARTQIQQTGSSSADSAKSDLTSRASTDLTVATFNPPGSTHRLQFRQNTLKPSETYGAEDMCGPPANVTSARGYQFPGYFHTVELTGLKPGALYRYRVGQQGIWSSIHVFRAPPPPLKAPAQGHRVTYDENIRFLMVGDHGVAGCFAHSYGCLGSASVAEALAREISTQSPTADSVPVSLLKIVGDISYATGRTLTWKRFMAQFQSIASHIPVLVTPGNHEYDVLYAPRHRRDISGVTFPGFRPAFLRKIVAGAGGECGVPTVFHFPAPRSRAPVPASSKLAEVLQEARVTEPHTEQQLRDFHHEQGVVAEARTHAKLRKLLKKYPGTVTLAGLPKVEHDEASIDDAPEEPGPVLIETDEELRSSVRSTQWLESNSVFWYAHQHGSVLFIGLSAEHSLGRNSPQRIWLEATLKAARGYVEENEVVDPAVQQLAVPNLWIIVSIHRPLYCSHRSGYDFGHAPYLRRKLEPLFQLYRVDMVVSGHFHAYQRSCPVLDGRCQSDMYSVFSPPEHVSPSQKRVTDEYARAFEESGQLFSRDPEVYFQPPPPPPGTTLEEMHELIHQQQELIKQEGTDSHNAHHFGTISVLVGAGGIAHEGAPFSPAAWSRATDHEHFGFIRVTVKGVRSLAVEFVGLTSSGKSLVIDSFVIARDSSGH